MKPDIIADIQFLSPEEGGTRKVPIFATEQIPYFSCPLEFKGKYYDCRLLLDNIGTIQLGSHINDIPIRFLTRLLEDQLSVGASFTLWNSGIFARGVVKVISWDISPLDKRPKNIDELKLITDQSTKQN